MSWLFTSTLVLTKSTEYDPRCYCDSTITEYEKLTQLLAHANCNNVFVRNPQLLIVNATLSILCFLAVLIVVVILLILFGSYLCSSSNDTDQRFSTRTTIISGIRDYTVEVH